MSPFSRGHKSPHFFFFHIPFCRYSLTVRSVTFDCTIFSLAFRVFAFWCNSQCRTLSLADDDAWFKTLHCWLYAWLLISDNSLAGLHLSAKAGCWHGIMISTSRQRKSPLLVGIMMQGSSSTNRQSFASCVHVWDLWRWPVTGECVRWSWASL